MGAYEDKHKHHAYDGYAQIWVYFLHGFRMIRDINAHAWVQTKKITKLDNFLPIDCLLNWILGR